MDSPSRLLLSPDCENGYLIVALYTITKTINGINTKNNEMIAPICLYNFGNSVIP